MNENPWQRLSRIAYARMDHLGMTQADLTSVGGPSPAWVRKLKATTGHPSSRHTRSLRDLSVALGWEPDQARSLLVDDRKGWSDDVLQDEETALIEDGHAPARTADPRPVSVVSRFRDLLRSDDMAGVTEDEWADLLQAIEAKMPKPAARGKRPQRKTGT